MQDNPTISICLITYNQQNFIRQCLNGCLIQQLSVPYEIIIGDDCSSDDTSVICQEFVRDVPEISYERNSSNLGMVDNWLKTVKRCRGKYIAICEGDDYWTDPLKLQKQVDFLEANPDFAICFHRVEVKYEDDDAKSHLSNLDQKEVTAFEDLAEGNYIHTPSCVFRSGLFEKLPDWFRTSPVGDYLLHLLNAEHGKIKFFGDVMAVYRVHQGGVWGMADIIRKCVDMAKVVENCKRFFAPRGAKQFDKNLNYIYKDLLFACSEKNFNDFRKYFFKFLEVAQLNQSRLILYFTKIYLLSFTSSFFRNRKDAEDNTR